jgi:hypothetical protein
VIGLLIVVALHPSGGVHLRSRRKWDEDTEVVSSSMCVEQYQYMCDLKRTLDAGVRIYPYALCNSNPASNVA